MFKSTMKRKVNPAMGMFSIRISPDDDFMIFVFFHACLFMGNYMKFFPITKSCYDPKWNQKHTLKEDMKNTLMKVCHSSFPIDSAVPLAKREYPPPWNRIG
jgi:hypothetical protein